MKGNRGAEARQARREAEQAPRETGAVPFREGVSRPYCFLAEHLDKLAKRACRCRGQCLFLFGYGGWLCLPATQILIL